jgi:hypothetical protein
MDMNGRTPKVQVINRLTISKSFIASDPSLKKIAEDYGKKTAEFGKLLVEVKAASKALKEALEPKLKLKGIDVNEGSEWKAIEGKEKGTLIVEIINRQKEESSRQRIPVTAL